jgi:hypothetical protein
MITVGCVSYRTAVREGVERGQQNGRLSPGADGVDCQCSMERSSPRGHVERQATAVDDSNAAPISSGVDHALHGRPRSEGVAIESAW